MNNFGLIDYISGRCYSPNRGNVNTVDKRVYIDPYNVGAIHELPIIIKRHSQEVTEHEKIQLLRR